LANKNAKILGDKKYILGMLIAVPARTWRLQYCLNITP
jgi:hypothetical protein